MVNVLKLDVVKELENVLMANAVVKKDIVVLLLNFAVFPMGANQIMVNAILKSK